MSGLASAQPEKAREAYAAALQASKNGANPVLQMKLDDLSVASDKVDAPKSKIKRRMVNLMHKGWQKFSCLLLGSVLLYGCSSEEDVIKMAEVPVIESAFHPETAWSHGIGSHW